nr:MAG TPA: hypothetical protein [Bacteriophage sp.]DAQ87707.1 MAG TPA: hypothetical protein [Caudoviricetes sp.]DAV54077.1 MAG TPA: hypothetical protein [Caudoviricetes sp.]
MRKYNLYVSTFSGYIRYSLNYIEIYRSKG